VGDVDAAGAQLRLTSGAAGGAVEVRRRAHEQGAAVLTAEHAGENPRTEGDLVEDLAALTEAQY
jgi:hypothetical protein